MKTVNWWPGSWLLVDVVNDIVANGAPLLLHVCHRCNRIAPLSFGIHGSQDICCAYCWSDCEQMLNK